MSDEATYSGDLIRKRIETIYQQATGYPRPFGALSWFARLLDVTPYTVTRWTQGKAPRQIVLLIEALEFVFRIRAALGEVVARAEREEGPWEVLGSLYQPPADEEPVPEEAEAAAV